MNERLEYLFNLYKNLRSSQNIINEILTLDYYVYNFDENEAISLIDYCVKKYNREIKLIASLKRDKVVVDNDPTLYEEKDEEEINSDAEYIRDCLIIIGAVQSGIRASIRDVMEEIGWVENWGRLWKI